MNRVHILPPDVISKIAAGEVIERPASVIKELIENSLDAQTDAIELRLQQAGKTAIHIKDSGSGIHRDDIQTIFERHSTSKIRTIDDLFDIHSLGFRGEALYSIAAVSDVILRSKPKDQDTGWEIHMRGGETINLKPVTMQDGTEIEIKELFFNTPARRKFLKTNTTELNQILNIVIPYTLLHPQCRFLLTHEKKTLLDLKSTTDLKQRIARVLNLEKDHLLEVGHNFALQKFSARLILGDINITRTRRDLQFVFINGRPVQSKTVSFHLNDVYRLILPPGYSPFFTVFLQIPPGDIDVNIHPTKREVKIKDEHNLLPLLRHMVENTLMTAGKAKEATLKNTLAPAPPDGKTLQRALSQTTAEAGWDDHIPAVEMPAAAIAESERPTEHYSFPSGASAAFPDQNLFGQKPDTLQGKFSRSRYIGSFINKFLLFEADQSLLIVDQHAAQERISFEHLIRQMEKGDIGVQNLLAPHLLKLTPQEFLIWEDGKDKLDSIGFSTTQFDDETIAIHSYPVLLRDAVKAVRDLLAGGNFARCDHETIARRACRCSVMAGDALKPAQAEYQREQLLLCRDPFTCPHGRPTIIEMKENFLDRQFLRT